MRYFIDTEFNAPGAGKPIDLISIGVVSEDGRGCYFENGDALKLDVSPWIRENVLPHLALSKRPAPPFEVLGYSLAGIATGVREFIGDDPEPEFWGYYCAFDYVILSQLMGGMDAWPTGWPYYMRDLRQWLDYELLDHVKQPDDAPHNALEDARWIRDTLNKWWPFVTQARAS